MIGRYRCFWLRVGALELHVASHADPFGSLHGCISALGNPLSSYPTVICVGDECMYKPTFYGVVAEDFVGHKYRESHYIPESALRLCAWLVVACQ